MCANWFGWFLPICVVVYYFFTHAMRKRWQEEAMLTSPYKHRRSRRVLTQGATPPTPSIAVTVTSTGTTNFTMTFNQPVVISGTIQSTVATRTLVSQTVVSSTVVTQVWSGNVTGLAYTVPTEDPAVRSASGGRLLGTSGTFP